jgi:hypothetical protein
MRLPVVFTFVGVVAGLGLGCSSSAPDNLPASDTKPQPQPFLGIAEDRARRIEEENPDIDSRLRGITTMSEVQSSDYATYLRLKTDGTVVKDANESDYLMRVTPTEFFSGELKRLKPHVDFDAACFKIETRGSVRCRPEIEMWCDGKRVDKPKYGYLRDRGADEVTLSWRRKVVDNQVAYPVTIGGLYTFSRHIEEPKSAQKVEIAFGPVSIRKPLELKSKGDSVIVWAMGTGHGADLGKAEDVEKM